MPCFAYVGAEDNRKGIPFVKIVSLLCKLIQFLMVALSVTVHKALILLVFLNHPYQSLALPAFFSLYFSTLRPFAAGVCGLLLPLNRRFAVPAVFGTVGGGGKGLAADGAPFQRLPLENPSFQSFPFLIFQQHMAEELAADGIRIALGASDRLAPVQIQAISIVVVAAQALDEPHRLTPLLAVHVVQGAVRPPFHRR